MIAFLNLVFNCLAFASNHLKIFQNKATGQFTTTKSTPKKDKEMGTCNSSQLVQEKKELKTEKKTNKKIQHDLEKLHQSDQEIKKLLLLGAGESGKSTLFKQMIALYGKGFSEDQRQSYRGIVFQNVIRAMKVLVQNMDELKAEFNVELEVEHQEAAKRTKNLLGNEEMTEEIAADIQALWKDSGIQKIYENRSRFQFPDSGPYFFSRVNDMIKKDYIPNQQDVLRSRVRSTGMLETDFEVEGNQFRVFDVGGQRNERRKWIHCFENVSCVIFVAAISEYDQVSYVFQKVLFEDEVTNRVVEAIHLFDDICNSSWFVKTSIILFLNKRDLFMEKIHKIPLNTCEPFKDYNGPLYDYDSGCEYFRAKFEQKNRSEEKEVYTHVTCATDTSNVSRVFDSVKAILIKQSLRDGNFCVYLLPYIYNDFIHTLTAQLF
ncbi:G Protein, Alpha subunit family member (gpa-3) [Reticulomyxa filosa]|uniref:G Protein, Alpha subunit family member (Gpa-3) n=1 Tax=Reticulomyxa filosa TaxID=46433 RepID=X6M0W0_RETFI|nr:G Protein, Alpha subunit family member (gpa-3) [Reticulomyxa filosa]|eukprot:ETO06615.1 G Protein, Alpha subunit family member (gpa-3) [Reticulomyxa filosa]